MQEDNNKPSVHYQFIKQYQINFGQALYLTGSLQELGTWNPTKAIRMSCKHDKYWITSVVIPLDVRFQFKYFVGPFNLSQDNTSAIKWMQGKNEWLCIPNQLKSKFQRQNSILLNIMSFNLRLQNKNDKGDYSWQSRRQNCCQLILKYMPDIVGVQQPKSNQVQYVVQMIGHFYQYFGQPRDLKEDEHSGIFIRKDKFIVREKDYVWINQDKIPGKVAFGARLPRYFTYLVIQPIHFPHKKIMIVNTHLDHQSNLSRLNGVKIITQKIQQTVTNFGQTLRNIFITGDFNASDHDPIFDSLMINSSKIQSIRHILPKEQSDFQQTFNGFRPKIMNLLSNTIKLSKYIIIDHIFSKSEDYKPLKLEVLRNENNIISDHYPIIGYFQAINAAQTQ